LRSGFNSAQPNVKKLSTAIFFAAFVVLTKISCEDSSLRTFHVIRFLEREQGGTIVLRNIVKRNTKDVL